MTPYTGLAFVTVWACVSWDRDFCSMKLSFDYCDKHKTPKPQSNILLESWTVWHIHRLEHIVHIAYARAVKCTYEMNKDTQIEKKNCTLSSTHMVSQRHNQFLVVWKAARSVWHWLLSANSTLGAALASFAANPGKEITDTHNAVFCSSAKKKTSLLRA